MNKKKILFISGTRADFGKLKPLIKVVQESSEFEEHIFITGMHTMKLYGLTQNEVIKSGFKNYSTFINQIPNEPMEQVLANTINAFSRYVHENKPDLIVVHGDRVEALAGAIVGALKNILVAHIEGGERSGTIDELIRHSVSKMSHAHFVSNDEARKRLLQLGEKESSIFVIGSPDIELMLGGNLPSLDEVRKHYHIPFSNYAIFAFHPVTTELNSLKEQIQHLVDAILQSKLNYVVIYPNNDEGTHLILGEIKRLEGMHRFKLIPSLRFEYFITLLKNAEFVIGNSSAGIREAPVFGVPTVNVGTRQSGRFSGSSVFNCDSNSEEIAMAIKKVQTVKGTIGSNCYFGGEESSKLFYESLKKDSFWKIETQKLFQDI